MHAYNEVFNGGLRLESVTPMALNNKKHNIICVILRDKLRHFMR